MPTNLISRIEGLLEKASPTPVSIGHPSTHGGWWEFPVHVGLGENRGNCFARFGLGGKGAISSAYEDIEVAAQLYVELRNAAPALMRVLKAAQEWEEAKTSYDAVNRKAQQPRAANSADIRLWDAEKALRSALAELEERDA